MSAFNKIPISILPSLLTVGNFVCGLICIIFCIQSIFWQGSSAAAAAVKQAALFQNACLIILLGMIFDMLDGRVARLTHSQSQLGGELDSLADMCTFGIAPSVILATLWMRAMPDTAEWWSFSLIAAIIYSSCAMLRLAIYNLSISESAKGHFSGLPSPAAAGCIVGTSLFFTQDYVANLWNKFYDAVLSRWITDFGGCADQRIVAVYIFSVYIIIVGLLMVSHFRFAHVANLWLGKTKKIYLMIAVIAGILLLSMERTRNPMIFIGFNGYVSICLFVNIRNRWRHQESKIDQDITQILEISDEEDIETDSDSAVDNKPV
ncbi:hypothetical protein AGMMS49959_09370 [Planctomycetales bacterium]|nr:hypothetical protein AGMMS49959_09370 [Planctomycetales bacterium]